MNLSNYKKLNEDEQELFDLLIFSGLKDVISIAQEKFVKENEEDVLFSFLVEIQNLLEKLGYDFKFEVKEIKKIWNVEENSNSKKL